jgi:hypothetical protein
MFHYHKLMKKSLALLLLTGGYTSLVGQSVIDPSATNANYAAEKGCARCAVSGGNASKDVKECCVANAHV